MVALKAKGIENAAALLGGFNLWQQQGKPVEKKLEATANGTTAGTIVASMRAPYFYTASNTARVNLAIEIPSSAVKFEKQKGKEHAEINILGIAYKPDGAIAARSSASVY